MPPPPNVLEKLATALVVILSLAALALTTLAPGFYYDNVPVYGRF